MGEAHILELIKKRHSVRLFSSEEISNFDLQTIMEAGLYAPSGKNRRPWRFVVIKNKKILQVISELTVFSKFIRKAGALILVYVDSNDEYPIEKDILSIGGCVQNILLTATEMGVSTCVIGELFGKEKEINAMIQIEQNSLALVSGIAVGRSKMEYIKREELDLADYLLCDLL